MRSFLLIVNPAQVFLIFLLVLLNLADEAEEMLHYRTRLAAKAAQASVWQSPTLPTNVLGEGALKKAHVID